MNRKAYKEVCYNRYIKIVGRFVRQMEKEVIKVQREHNELAVGQAWDIVTDAYRQADKIVTGGYQLK